MKMRSRSRIKAPDGFVVFDYAVWINRDANLAIEYDLDAMQYVLYANGNGPVDTWKELGRYDTMDKLAAAVKSSGLVGSVKPGCQL